MRYRYSTFHQRKMSLQQRTILNHTKPRHTADGLAERDRVRKYFQKKRRNETLKILQGKLFCYQLLWVTLALASACSLTTIVLSEHSILLNISAMVIIINFFALLTLNKRARKLFWLKWNIIKKWHPWCRFSNLKFKLPKGFQNWVQC